MFRTALKSTRILIPLAVVGSFSVAGVIAWFTGLVDWATAKVNQLWDGIVLWINDPNGLSAVVTSLWPLLVAVVVGLIAYAVINEI